MQCFIRWSGELVTNSSAGKDGNTAHERLKGHTLAKPITQSGERVLDLPFGAPSADEHKVQNRMRERVGWCRWLHGRNYYRHLAWCCQVSRDQHEVKRITMEWGRIGKGQWMCTTARLGHPERWGTDRVRRQ